MPALPLHLLAQVVLQLQRQPRLATGEAFGDTLQVMAAHRRLGQLAQQFHQGRDRLLELIRAGEIAAGQHLLDLPVEPEGGGIEQTEVLAGAVLLEVLIGILAGRQVQHAQLQLALQRQLLHLPDRPLGGAHTGTVAVEVEDQAAAVAAAAELGDLAAAEGGAERTHRMADAGGMQGDDIEVALHDHRPVGAADRIGGAVQTEEVPPLFKHLRFGRIEVFRLAAIQAATAEPDHPALAVVDRHDHPMAEAVVVAGGGRLRPLRPFAAAAGHHQARGGEQLRLDRLHLLQVAQQPIPAIGGIAELEGLQGGLAQPAAIAQVGERLGSARGAQLALKPAGGEAEHPVQLIAAAELLAQALLLRPIEGLDGKLIAAGQLEHHIGEAAALQLHQKLDRVAAGTAGETVVELLGRRHRHRRRFVVVEGTEPHELPPLLLQHHVLAHHVDDVGALLHGFDRAGMEAGNAQDSGEREW